MPLEIIGTGTGRCCTFLLSEMLTLSGLSCGHEKIFNEGWTAGERDIRADYEKESQLKADISWCSAAYLDQSWIAPDVKIIHLIRHPLSVIRSFFDINFFSEDRIVRPLNQLVYANTTISAKNQDRLVSSIDHWFQWNQLIERKLSVIPNERIVVRAEDLAFNTEGLSAFLGRNIKYIAKPFNGKAQIKEENAVSEDELHRNLEFTLSHIEKFYGMYWRKYYDSLEVVPVTPGLSSV